MSYCRFAFFQCRSRLVLRVCFFAFGALFCGWASYGRCACMYSLEYDSRGSLLACRETGACMFAPLPSSSLLMISLTPESDPVADY